MKNKLCISIKTAVNLFLNGNVILIDIRDSRSFRLSRIYGSINISVNTVDQFFKKNSFLVPMIIICYHGISSKHIALYLKNKGYKKVYSVNGGFKEWSILFPQFIQYHY
ncbi:MAG TPA: rhodanese-like domain-containing protein [Buchnera sp. (in: enterobacteria)]|nr:rhodanese-like domain-containing protein [Buchnera sp. (in: enterobacteria)]